MSGHPHALRSIDDGAGAQVGWIGARALAPPGASPVTILLLVKERDIVVKEGSDRRAAAMERNPHTGIPRRSKQKESIVRGPAPAAPSRRCRRRT
jgi:hypothetical protein